MRRPILFPLAFAVVLTVSVGAAAQETPPGTDQQAVRPTAQEQIAVAKVLQDTRQALDKFTIELKAAASGMVDPVVTGAPYSAVTTNETIQTLADGNRIVNRTTYNVARDGQGRVRREEVREDGTVASIMIMDPVANASYVLDPVNRTARKVALLGPNVVSFRASSGWSVVPSTAARSEAAATAEMKAKADATGNFIYAGSSVVTVAAATKMHVEREPLGSQVMEGVPVRGTRNVSTIPAGSIGNERPIDIVFEQWYSNDLQMTIMSRNSDPRSGERTYRVTNVRRGEPDPTLFQVPGDYTVKEPVNEVLPKVVK
jgi:hypothetical protein